MRNSKKILLGAILASATLIGGAAAAFVVTDNADVIRVQVSPGQLQTDEKEGKIELSWGTNSIQDVENLGLGATAKVATLVLKADKADDTNFESYNGVLDFSFEDLTTKTTGARFIDYLDVKIYKGAINEVPEEGEPAGQILHTSKTKSSYFTATGTKEGEPYTAFVTLSNDATAVYNEIEQDQVYLKFNWNKATADTDAADVVDIIYMYDPTNKLEKDNDTLPYVYAYGAEGKVNAQWPGEQMTKVADYLYSYELKKSLDTIIFNGGEGKKQTVNIKYVAPDFNNNYYTISNLNEAEGKYNAIVGNVNPTTLSEYYVTGIIGGQDQWYTKVGFVEDLAMDADDTDNNKAIKKSLALKKDDKLKVIDKFGNYYGRPESEFGLELISEGVTVGSVDRDGNFVIPADGKYTIYLNNEYQIWCALETESGSGD